MSKKKESKKKESKVTFTPDKVKKLCPLCGKPVYISRELEAWRTPEEIKEMSDVIEILTEASDTIIETLHHHPKCQRHAYRLALFYTILDRLVSYSIMSNAEKCGILELVKSHVINEVFTIADLIKEEKKSKKAKSKEVYLI